MTRSACLTAALGALCLYASAVRAQGLIEINQVRAMAGGVTSSDGADFPVTIDAPGSYILTGDLAVGGRDTSAIQVTVDDVTLDLRGFSIRGPIACSGTGSGLDCGPTALGYGIDAGGRQRLVVRDGRVRGFGAGGIRASAGGRFQDLIVLGNGGNGLQVGESIVSEVNARLNLGIGIQVQTGSTVSRSRGQGNKLAGISGSFATLVIDSSTDDNGGAGISLESGIARSCSSTDNLGAGISCAQGCTFENNSASGNTGFGLALGTASLAQGNALNFNVAGAISASNSTSGYRENVMTGSGLPSGLVSGGTNLGDNLCNGVTCP